MPRRHCKQLEDVIGDVKDLKKKGSIDDSGIPIPEQSYGKHGVLELHTFPASRHLCLESTMLFMDTGSAATNLNGS